MRSNPIILGYCIRRIGGPEFDLQMYMFDIRKVNLHESTFPYDGP